MEKKVYILILNWNGWSDTLECLESVFRNVHANYHVVVCDNDSVDNSVERIMAWADGLLDIVTGNDTSLRALSWPPVTKPIPYSVLDGEDAEHHATSQASKRLTIIRTGKNLGFAGGNNVGLRYIMACGDHSFVWLLNNDTVIRSDALIGMLHRMEEKPAAGICGSTLVYYDKPELVQALGGARYSPCFASNANLGRFSSLAESLDREWVENNMSYVIGASMLVSRRFLDHVGQMNESYFLYFEELDWVERSKKEFSLAYAPESIVYHKEGSSAGTTSQSCNGSIVSDYFALSNRLIFTKLYFPWFLPVVYAGLLLAVFNRIKRGKMDRVAMILGILRRDRTQRSNFLKMLQSCNTSN
jgi:GT2 family glycosyltransferase